jgi:flagellar assembly protein FliH
MIEAVKTDVEEQSGHLAESEVAHLLAVLQNAEFKRSETRNPTKNNNFKPRSLMEIAIEAQKRDAKIEAVKQAEESHAAGQRSEGVPASEAQANEGQNFDDSNTVGLTSADPNLGDQGPATGRNDRDLIPTNDGENASLQTGVPDGSSSTISKVAPNVMPDPAPDIGSDDKPSGVGGSPGNDALAIDAAEHASTLDDNDGDAAPASEIASDFETVTAAFERGKAEGMIAGRNAGVAETKADSEAAARAELAETIATFEAALVALAKPQALQAEDLSRSIHTAILKLASQRAGHQIDEMPNNFLLRIEALVASIGQKMTAGKVHINADDYRVIFPYLADTHFDFIAETSLARGDVVLKFGGVELHDIAETRLGGQYAETAETIEEASKKPAVLSPEITPEQMTPGEITPAETTPVEIADVSNPVQNADDTEFDNAASNESKGDQSSLSSDETSS